MILTLQELQWMKENVQEAEALSPFYDLAKTLNGAEASALREKGILGDQGVYETERTLLEASFRPEKVGRVLCNVWDSVLELYSCQRKNTRVLLVVLEKEVDIRPFEQLESLMLDVGSLFYSVTPDFLKGDVQLDPFAFLCFCGAFDITRRNLLRLYVKDASPEGINLEEITAQTVANQIQSPFLYDITKGVTKAFQTYLAEEFPPQGQWVMRVEQELAHLQEMGILQRQKETETYAPHEKLLQLTRCFALTHGFMHLENAGYHQEELFLANTIILQGRYGNMGITCGDKMMLFTMQGSEIIDLIRQFLSLAIFEEPQAAPAPFQGEMQGSFTAASKVGMPQAAPAPAQGAPFQKPYVEDAASESKAKFCPACGHPYIQNAKFCSKCGQRL